MIFTTIGLALALQSAALPVEKAVGSEADTQVIAETEDQTLTAPNTPMEKSEPGPPPLVIPRDTPVRLMVLNEVSTKDHAAGHRFPLRVNEAVVVDGRELIPVGATAWGELTDAEKSGNVGKRGKLEAKLSHIDLDGREIPLEGGTSSNGASGKGETILGVLAMGPLGLFAKGNNAKIKAGEMMTAFVSEDVVLGDAE
ncbi:hypothetical protein SAMN06297468_1730 [Altererythrobacter xiamenensis]|uniref:Uncharacterized protein n=1 Tax=Altererythrobacter xiamenensis TaxID=1316679 RepID=A0A1Y6F3T8_9SPHN|nr:hypothetical protein [Altererythrobacter xiamenensis]SMQ69544.1 hypothetical protein SAMN06297468_1730 [Altererythrobacter xiamenensis]